MDDSNDVRQRVASAHLQIAVANGRLISVLSFLQGGLAGWGFAQRSTRPTFAAILVVAPILVLVVVTWAYTRSAGILDSFRKHPNRKA